MSDSIKQEAFDIGNKYGDIRWKWLEERGFNVMSDKPQYEYMQALWAPQNVIQGVFCESPAGTGKTVLAVLAGAYGVENGDYDRIIYVRNTEVVGKDIGFLPGNPDEKVSPHMAPFVEALDHVKPGTYEAWVESEKAVATTFTHLRGITIDRAFIIADEAQSDELEELQALYTRLTATSKMVTVGSLRQIDNRRIRRYAGLTPFEIYMEHYRDKSASYHQLVTNYRGEWSQHADTVQDTIKRLTAV